MNLKHLLLLPLFGTLVVTSSLLNSVLFSAAITTVLGYVWIFLTWQDNMKQVAICYAIFAVAIGPLTYYGFSDVREGLTGLGYSWWKVYLFQPAGALMLPAISLTVRSIVPYAPLNGRDYLLRSLFEIVVGLPLLWIGLTFVP